MTIASTGVYTGPTGSTNAAPGTVIRSATWNTINTDYASAITQLAQQAWTPAAHTISSGPYTVVAADAALIFNVGGTATVVMPTASSFAGRWIRMKTVAAQAVVASASVVAPLTATTASTAILANTAGKWAALQSDGANWVVMMGN